MTNEEKANEIAKDMLPYNNAEYHACYNSAFQAMQWKDEVHAKEKQQLIDEACKWINDNYFEYLQPISYHEQLQTSIDIHDFVNDLKKAMKGE